MRFIHSFLLSSITAVANATFNWDNGTSSNIASIACEYFKKNHASMTLLPSDPEYEAENQGKIQPQNVYACILIDDFSVLERWGMAWSSMRPSPLMC